MSKKTVDFLRHDGSVPWRTRHPAGYSSPSAPGQKRAQPRIYGRTKKECLDNLVEASGYVAAGRPVAGRSTKFGEHLDRRLRWWGSEGDLKPSTLESYREAADLYLRLALGHLRIADLNPDLAAAMRKINRPEADDDRSDLMRRPLAARATRGRQAVLDAAADGRIKRVLAVASSALSDLVPHVLAVNPAAVAGSRHETGLERCCLFAPPR